MWTMYCRICRERDGSFLKAQKTEQEKDNKMPGVRTHRKETGRPRANQCEQLRYSGCSYVCEPFMCMQVHVWSACGGQRQILDVLFFSHRPHYYFRFWDRLSHCTSSSLFSLAWLVREPYGILLSLLTQCWDYRRVLMCPWFLVFRLLFVFCGFWRIKHRQL